MLKLAKWLDNNTQFSEIYLVAVNTVFYIPLSFTIVETTYTLFPSDAPEPTIWRAELSFLSGEPSRAELWPPKKRA